MENKKFCSKYIFDKIIFLIFIILFICIIGCTYFEKSKKEIIEENKDTNYNLSSYFSPSTDYNSPLSLFETTLNFEIQDLISEIETCPYIKIVASMPTQTPLWINDKTFWIEQDSEKTINIVYEREDESLAAVKRLAENEIKTRIDINLRFLLDLELSESFKILNINDVDLLSFIRFEIQSVKFNINPNFKENYWQYIIIKFDNQNISFYRYYIYLKLFCKSYEEIRNQFILKLYNQKINDRSKIELIINYFQIKR